MGKRNGIETISKVTQGTLLSKQKVTEEYILQSAVNKQEDAKLAIALSSFEVMLFDLKTNAKTLSYKGHEKSITGMKFSKENPNVLLTSSLDGNIYAWDTRKGIKPALTYSDNSDDSLKPLLCFDMNASENYVCAGTELVREDSFIIFWDQRSTKNLGGYWHSHTDDITHVQFDSECESALASSSVDGLINIYDLNERSEDDALVNTLNTESSVNKFCWGAGNLVSCITGTEDYQFWSTESTSPSLSVSRSDLSKRFELSVDCLIDTYVVDRLFYLVTGSNDGFVQLCCQNKKDLKQVATFEKGHSDVVRTVCHTQDNLLITGGEDGHLCTWKIS